MLSANSCLLRWHSIWNVFYDLCFIVFYSVYFVFQYIECKKCTVWITQNLIYISYLTESTVFVHSDSKVNCTLVQALRLCSCRTAYRGSRVIVLPYHDHGTRRGCGVSVTPRPLFTPGKDLVHIVQEVGWAPGPVWTGAENLALTAIRSPDPPTDSQLLYRLCYPSE